MKKIKFIIFSLTIIVISYFSLTSFIIGKDNLRFIKSILSEEQKIIIKKYLFPYKFIAYQEQTIASLKNNDIKKELRFKDDLKDTLILKDSKLSNGMFLEKFKLDGGFEYGIWPYSNASGFIDFYNNDIFILSAGGVLVFSKNFNNDKVLKQIQNNINEFINLKHYSKSDRNWFSLKDVLIDKDKIYVSFTEEIEKDCWNTSIIYGKIDYKNINFEKLFSPTECVHSIKNIDNDFNAWQSGGKMISLDDDHILLSVGDYRNRYLAQDKKSINGKIIKININNGKFTVISMGHRNPQGLYLDMKNNFVIETEHGPRGGDEINIIEIEKINKSEILNYGWPVVSTGEHYIKSDELYKKYPLYKSHEDHGFIEPLKSFNPSIAISEVIKIMDDKYVVGSMKDKSLYFFELNKKREIFNLERVEVFERIRDLSLNNNKLYLFLENSGSIGVINLN